MSTWPESWHIKKSEVIYALCHMVSILLVPVKLLIMFISVNRKVSLVAFVYGIIYPAYYRCMEESDSPDSRTCQELSWYIALGSNFITGIIILVLCLFGEFIRRNIPAVALLSSISAVGFTYLSLNQFIPVASVPIVSFLPFAVVILGYMGRGCL